MKKVLVLLCTILCANVLLAQTRFWVDSLQYEVTSTNPAEVELYSSNQSIVIADIPATVTYEETNYSVTAIGDEAFKNRNSLISVTIPESITSINSLGIFFGCSNLRILNFNAINCADFPYFYPQSGYAVPITSLNIGNNVQRLPACFMTNADSLTSVNIPNSVIEIGSRAFMYCDNLTSVTIGNSVTSIGESAFEDCSSLTSVTIPNSVIGVQAFYGCSSLTSVNIGNGVTTIGSGAFGGCSSLTSVNIPNSVTSIGNEAFKDCLALNTITIGEGVTSISENCFKNCNVLMFVNLGSNVNFIRNGAFGDSQFLQNVTCLATTPPTISGNTAFPYPNTATLTVPCGTLEAYSASTSLWNMFFADRIEEDCSGIEQAETESISFFPNPTKSEITFSQAIEKVEVIDLTGKTIFTFTNAKTINIESLPAGAYYLKLTNEEIQSFRKFIKQ